MTRHHVMASPTAGSATFSSLFSPLLVWCGPWPNPPPTLRFPFLSLPLPSPFLPPTALLSFRAQRLPGRSGQLPRRLSRLARLLSGSRSARLCAVSFRGHRAPTACSIRGAAFPDCGFVWQVSLLTAPASVAYCGLWSGRPPLPSTVGLDHPLLAGCLVLMARCMRRAPLERRPDAPLSVVRLGPWPHRHCERGPGHDRVSRACAYRRPLMDAASWVCRVCQRP